VLAVSAARLRAIRDELGDAPRVHLIAQPVDLLHPGGDLDSVRKAADAIGAKLIILDTLARMMVGGDENGHEDMGRFIHNVGMLRSYRGAHVAVVHHGTKNPNGRTPRGHGSLIGAADLVVEIAKVGDGNRTATVTAAKDDPDGGVMGFRLRVVELGEDQDGDPTATCMVDEYAQAPIIKPALSATERKARDILAALITGEGKPLPTGAAFPLGLAGVTEERWRAECEALGLSIAETEDGRTKAFRRACVALLDAKVIGCGDGVVWIAGQDVLL